MITDLAYRVLTSKFAAPFYTVLFKQCHSAFSVILFTGFDLFQSPIPHEVHILRNASVFGLIFSVNDISDLGGMFPISTTIRRRVSFHCDGVSCLNPTNAYRLSFGLALTTLSLVLIFKRPLLSTGSRTHCG